MPQIVTGHKPPFTRIRVEAFWARFTAAELVDFDVACQHNPADNATAKKDAARLRTFRWQTDLRGFVRLNASITVAVLNQLSPGVLTAARRDAIRDTAIASNEAYIVPGEMQ